LWVQSEKKFSWRWIFLAHGLDGSENCQYLSIRAFNERAGTNTGNDAVDNCSFGIIALLQALFANTATFFPAPSVLGHVPKNEITAQHQARSGFSTFQDRAA
jgi:hypothetical protein